MKPTQNFLKNITFQIRYIKYVFIPFIYTYKMFYGKYQESSIQQLCNID